MINADAEMALEYLLSPEFELINSAGKPLTGGWIEVYLHGTRDKYYCYSDWAGTLHPFKIPLDSIGANVVLADPNNAYDVYVYNKFGSLIMSRYNVKCQGSGGSSTYVGDKLYYGQYRASNVTTIANLRRNKGNINITDDGYLKLKSGMSYHITVRGSFTVDDPANEDTTLNYIEYTSVNPIKIDIDETKEGPQYFELSYDIYRLQEDMDYQVAFAQSNGMVTDLIVEVHSLSNLATSAAGGDQEYEAGWGIDITNNVVSVDPSILEDYEYTAGDYISIDENNVISVTGINPADYATHDEVYEATVTAIELVTGLIPDAQVQSDWNETDTEDPAYIKNKPDLDIYATHDEVNNVSGKIIETVNNVSGVLHEEVMEVSGSIIHYQGASGINVEGDTISLEEPLYIEAGSGINFTSEGDTITINADPIDLSDYATHDEVNTVSGELVNVVCAVSSVLQDEIDNIPPQVQSDWDQDDDTQVDYIKNKPTETELVAGQNIGLFAEGTTLTICASATDLSDYATHDEVNNVSGKIIETVNNVSGNIIETVNNVSGQIIETVNNVSGDIIETVNNVSGVLHEEVMEVSGSIIHYQGASGINVEGDTISLEEPLYIEAGSGINFTSEGDTITINADPVDLSDYVTHVELEEAISAVTGIGDYGQFYATNISGAATMARTKGTIDVTNDGKIKLKKGSSYHVTMRGRYNQTTASNTLSTLSLIEYITNNSISVNVDTTITDSQYFEISYDLYKLNSDTNYYVFFNVPAGKINDLFVEIHAIGSVGAGVSGGAGTEYDAGWGIQILNNVISVDPSILNDYTTNGDVYNSTVSAINLVTGLIPEAQVQSDWTEADDTDPAYIKNKPEEYNLVAGDNITIDVSGTNIVISSEGGIASGASGCNVEFVNILDYQGQITDREPGAQTTYTGGTALANAMRDIMIRGHIPFLVYGAPAQITEVFTPIWIDTREFARGTNGGYSCVPLTGHEFFFKNPVTSFVTTKIVIDALNDKISDFIVSADTVATVGRGLTVDYFGAGDPWVWYEGSGPTPPASASTTPGLCRIEIASSIPDVNKVQTMIDTSIASLPITGLPTTELGKFTIQSNVSGGPIEVLVPTDEAPVSAIYDLNAQYDDTLSNRTGPSTYYYVFKSPGYDNDTWTAISGDVIQLKVKETIQGLGAIIGFYASNSSPASSNAPTINYPNSTPLVAGTGVTYVVEPGVYTTALGANPAGSSYGKYITLMINTGGSGIYVDDILNKIEFTIGRPNAALGTTVNLNRYYLANSVNTSTPSSELACQVTVDSASKQQKVYLPGYMPSNWKGDIAQAFQYGTNGNSPNDYNYNTKQYRAYKYTSSPRRYQFAYCTDWDVANKLMTFVAYDNSGNAIEKWTLNYTTYSSNVWTTTPISSGGTEYTAGDHISIENDEIAVTGITELVAGENITITTSGASAIISGQAGGSSYTAGTGIDITNDVISVDNTVAMKTDLPEPISGASGITVNDSVVSLDNPIGLVAGSNITIEVSGVSAIISSTGGGGGGSSYTAGTGIDITNNEISVDNTVALKTDVTAAVSGKSDKFTVLTYDVSTWSDFQTALSNNTVILAKNTIGSETDYYTLTNVVNNTATFTNLRKVNHSVSAQSDITMGVTLNSNNTWDSLGEEYSAVSVSGGNGIDQSYSGNVLTLSINPTEIATAVSGLLPGGVTPVQSNWNETDSSSLAYIQNKPTIPAAPVQSNWNETNSSSLAYIQNKPTIPAAQVQANWNETSSSSMAYIKNKPTIPDISGCALKSVIAWSGWDYYTNGVNYIVNNNVGQAGFRFYPGNLFTSYSLQDWTYSESPMYTASSGTTAGAVFIRFSARLNNVIGTQWSSHNNVIQLNKGHIMEFVYEVCGDGWNSGNIVLKTSSSWTQSVEGILRDVRNSSSADNNSFYLHFSTWVGI